MAIALGSNLKPKNGGTFYLVEDVYIKGGFQVQDDAAARDAIDGANLKKGMMVLTADDMKVWILQEDLVTWSEFKSGGGGGMGKRVRGSHTTPELEANAFEEFDMDTGNCAILLMVEVDAPCLVEIYGNSKRVEENPYRFIATVDHLIDDGRTLMGDGTTIIQNRRYSIVCNLDEDEALSGKTFFRITNLGTAKAAITVDIVFLTLEA